MTEHAMKEARALEFVKREIYDRCGIRLDPAKHALIKARLGKRMRHHGFTEFSEYCRFLQKDSGDEEFTAVVDAITTNFTNFLREPDHFEFLVRTALGGAAGTSEKRFHIWSAACSSGEEPYTIAFFLEEHFPSGKGWNWRVEASDISTRMLEKARSGIYPAERAQPLPREWLPRYFQRGSGGCEGLLRVKGRIRERVRFSQINLIEEYRHETAFEAIFCRNVMIYFDRQTQEQLVNRLCQFLAPKGWLFVGHSESLNGLSVPLRCLRPSIYQKQ